MDEGRGGIRAGLAQCERRGRRTAQYSVHSLARYGAVHRAIWVGRGNAQHAKARDGRRIVPAGVRRGADVFAEQGESADGALPAQQRNARASASGIFAEELQGASAAHAAAARLLVDADRSAAYRERSGRDRIRQNHGGARLQRGQKGRALGGCSGRERAAAEEFAETALLLGHWIF